MDSAVSALQETFSTNNDWAEWSTLVIAVGLLGELLILFAFSKEMSGLEKTLLVIANFVIFAGVGGEYHFGSKANEAGKEIQRLSNEKIAALTDDAEKQKKDTATADEKIKTLDKDIESLKGDNLEKEKEIVDLQKQLADAQRHIAARDISDDRRAKFVNSIKGHKRTVTLILPDDQEARAFGVELVQPMLEKAGFVVKIEDLQGTSKHVGIIVCDNGAGEIKLHQAFIRAKIPARLFTPKAPDYPDFCHPRLVGAATFRVFIGQRDIPLAPH